MFKGIQLLKDQETPRLAQYHLSGILVKMCITSIYSWKNIRQSYWREFYKIAGHYVKKHQAMKNRKFEELLKIGGD